MREFKSLGGGRRAVCWKVMEQGPEREGMGGGAGPAWSIASGQARFIGH